MALCRCKKYHSNPKGTKNNYITYKEPVGYPKTSSICGRDGCVEAGVIWLTSEEITQYNNGARIFSFVQTNVSKVEVK